MSRSEGKRESSLVQSPRPVWSLSVESQMYLMCQEVLSFGTWSRALSLLRVYRERNVSIIGQVTGKCSIEKEPVALHGTDGTFIIVI